MNIEELRPGVKVTLLDIDEAEERSEGPGIDDDMTQFFGGKVLTISKKDGEWFRIEEDENEYVYSPFWIDQYFGDRLECFKDEEIEKFMRLGITL